jgi:hypothetical protein
MKRKILRIRIFYWLGAILDARVGIILLIRRYLELPDFIRTNGPSVDLLGALQGVGEACALMWGWTFLLIWADRKPLERRGVILLTAFPVVFLLLGNNMDIVLRGFDTVLNQSINFGIGIILIVFALYCYIEAGKIEKELKLR